MLVKWLQSDGVPESGMMGSVFSCEWTMSAMGNMWPC